MGESGVTCVVTKAPHRNFPQWRGSSGEMLDVRSWGWSKFCYVGSAEPPGASFRTEGATYLMEVFEGGG